MTRRLSWTEEDMRAAVVRALKLLKGSDEELTIRRVAICSARYTKASVAVLEKYISERTAEQRIELGYPDSSPQHVNAPVLRHAARRPRYRGTW